MDKLKKILKYDKKVMTFLNIITIIGIITGSIFIVILNKGDKSLVINSIKQFFSNLSKDKFDYILIFKNAIISNTLFSFVIWIIGISVIGVIIVICILFYKSFTLGFTISSIIYTYKLKGIVLSIFYVFPHMIINILILLYLSSYSIKLSIILIKSIIKKENLNFKSFFNNYIQVLLISLIFIVISSLYESFISLQILKYIAKLLI